MRHRPLLCGTLGFASGIGLWSCGWHSLAALAAAGFLSLFLLASGRPPAATAGLILAGTAIGALRMASFTAVPATDLSRYADRSVPVQVMGIVASDPEIRRGRANFTLVAVRITTRGQEFFVTGQASVALPAASPSLDYGDRVSINGLLETPPDATNPGAFSWREFLSRRGVYCRLRVRRPQAVEMLGASASNPLLAFAWKARHLVLCAVNSVLPTLPAAVLSGILIGWRASLPPALMDDFIRTGTVHILASAGLHVGIVSFWLLKLCERLTLPRKASACLIIAALIVYAFMCGGRPSVTRAVVMAAIYFAATLFERDPDLPTTLAAAALVILFLRPTALLESGFQLSFLTVLTLAVGMPAWNDFWKPRVRLRVTSKRWREAALFALNMAGLSLLAQIGSLPIVARDYDEVSVLGIAANLLVVPVLFALIPLGFAGALAWPLWHVLGAAVLLPCALLLKWIVTVVQACAAPVWASRAVPPPSVAWMALYYAVVLGALLTWQRHMRDAIGQEPCACHT